MEGYTPQGGGGWGVLQILSDGPGMIKGFFEFEIFNSGIFLARKFGKYFIVWLDLSKDF